MIKLMVTVCLGCVVTKDSFDLRVVNCFFHTTVAYFFKIRHGLSDGNLSTFSTSHPSNKIKQAYKTLIY